MNRNSFLILVAIIAVVVGFGLWEYYNHFVRHLTFARSNDPSDWGSFGSYISAFITLANTLVFIILTCWLIRIDENFSRSSQNREILLNSPRVIARVKYDSKDRDNWEIVNLGRGIALNIRVGLVLNEDHNFRDVLKPDLPNYPKVMIHAYGLGSDGCNIDLDWISYSIRAIIVLYSDSLNPVTEYVSISTHHQNQIMNRKELEANKETHLGDGEFRYDRHDINRLIGMKSIGWVTGKTVYDRNTFDVNIKNYTEQA